MLFKNDMLSSFGWMTLAGFCYGQFGKDPVDILVRNFTIIPYVKLRKVNITNTYIIIKIIIILNFKIKIKGWYY